MAQAQKYSIYSLITTGLIYYYFQMRMLHGWGMADISIGDMVQTYIAVIILFVISEAVIAGFLGVRSGKNSIEKDERDLLIERRAEQYSSWFMFAAINVVILHLLADGLYADHRLIQIDLTNVPTLFFVLFTILFGATIVMRISTILLYAFNKT